MYLKNRTVVFAINTTCSFAAASFLKACYNGRLFWVNEPFLPVSGIG